MSSANVLEIFSSVQGEGKYIGCRQIFVRLASNKIFSGSTKLYAVKVKESPNSCVIYHE